MSVLPHTATAAGAWRAPARASAIIVLVLLQLTVLDRNYHFPLAVAQPGPPLWFAINTGLKWFAYAALFGAVMFGLLALARARDLASQWRDAARGHAWGRWLGAEIAVFTLLLAALPIFSAGAEAPPWLALAAWLTAGAAMLACAGLALAPPRFWRAFAAQGPSAYWLALGVGALTFAALPLSQNSWDALSAATLQLSYAILQIYEPSARMEADTFLLGAGDFAVLVRAACSGYEGVALVLCMLGFYIFAFRRDLRFPHVLLLLPIGVAAIWLSNALRLALLVSIGAHVSPQAALNGFHAQAGWVMFLAVTISLMALAHHMRFFRAGQAPRAAAPDPALKLAAALLAPFAALMAARIGGAMSGELWISAALIVLPAGAIWAYRAPIRRELSKIGWEPVLIGLLVGALWIATEPAGESALGAWLAEQPQGAAPTWLALRIFGFALIVPIAEELTFRGYLHRALAARRFETSAPGAFTWAAFLITSLLFGAMHGRWLAGALAGAAFALALYRSKTLAAPIAAHMAANGLIAAYALFFAEWSLL
jgi:exosortase E/protease (VPEID-CTERM system)